jgi:uracil phosphoribosyltransferase
MEQYKDHPKIHIMSHPLIAHKVAILRDARTGTNEFRKVVSEIAALMAYEATRNMPTEEVEVRTPVGTARCQMLAGKKLAVVPILRAGLGMVDGILTLLPSAKVGHIGLFRDETTLEPVEYFCKLPPDIAERDILLVDPMLATGGSAGAAIQSLKNHGGRKITMLNLLAAPEGLDRIAREHPDVEVLVAALDDHLNEHGYIVPGLGDAGDRIFGTR